MHKKFLSRFCFPKFFRNGTLLVKSLSIESIGRHVSNLDSPIIKRYLFLIIDSVREKDRSFSQQVTGILKKNPKRYVNIWKNTRKISFNNRF